MSCYFSETQRVQQNRFQQIYIIIANLWKLFEQFKATKSDIDNKKSALFYYKAYQCHFPIFFSVSL